MATSGDTTERAPAHRFLALYMNDQLASGLVFREVAFRAAKENAGTELGEALAIVAAAIAEDIATFERMMGRLEIERSKVKPRLAVALERLARLKLNGRLLGYSPLSRFEELDLLVMGIEGKKILWANLANLAGLSVRLGDFDFSALTERAERQRAALAPFHEAAGRDALGRD